MCTRTRYSTFKSTGSVVISACATYFNPSISTVHVYFLPACSRLPTGVGGFLPAVKQIANVAALPGIVGVSKSVKV